MTKLLSSVGLAIAVATASLAGCQLYFGDHANDNGRDPGGTGSGRPPGFECNGDAQCAAGCFCSADGVCAEGGFCTTDKQCGTGFVCDVARGSCKPKPAPTCTMDTQCAAGSVCDTGSGSCVVTCSCASDAEAVQKGAGWCDETRGTCMTGSDPAGACLGTVTCTTETPKCGEGEVPLVKDGCFTGQCRAIAACEAAPVCGSLQHLDDCTSRSDCNPSIIGHDCTDACSTDPTSPECKCTTYVFAECRGPGAAPGFTVGD